MSTLISENRLFLDVMISDIIFAKRTFRWDWWSSDASVLVWIYESTFIEDISELSSWLHQLILWLWSWWFVESKIYWDNSAELIAASKITNSEEIIFVTFNYQVNILMLVLCFKYDNWHSIKMLLWDSCPIWNLLNLRDLFNADLYHQRLALDWILAAEYKSLWRRSKSGKSKLQLLVETYHPSTLKSTAS